MGFFNNLKVGLRMSIGFGVLVLIIFYTGLSWYFAGARNMESVNELAEERLPGVIAILTMEYEFEKVVRAQRTLLNPENPAEVISRQYPNIEDARARYRKAMDDYLKSEQTEEEKKYWDEFTTHLARWGESNERFLALSRKLDNTGISNPKDVMSQLERFKGDHCEVMSKALLLIVKGQEFEGEEDAATCAFGLWSSGFFTRNSVINSVISSVNTPHIRFHQAVKQVKDAVGKGDIELAHKIFDEEMRINAEIIFAGFDKIIEEIFEAYQLREEMARVAMEEVREIESQTLAALGEIARIQIQGADDQKVLANRQGRANMRLSLITLSIGFVLAVIFGFIVTRSILVPLRQSGELFKAIAAGDMTQTVPEELLEQKDELGDMGRQINEMTTALRKMFKDLGEGVETLASSSTELSAVSDQTAQGAKESRDRAEAVAAAAEELTATTDSMVVKMEDSAGNLNSVASAMEEMTSTIAEIASNTSTAHNSTEESVHQAESFAVVMRELGDAALQIGKVTETITSISDQTNLLALNATIEAARAGEAGRGFAVVAGEIKDLAAQTAEATQDISVRINGIQEASKRAETDIDVIIRGIGKVNDIVSAIASAIEEQTSAIAEVSTNINLASDMVNEASNQSSEMKNVSEEISRDMASVSASAVQVEGASAQLQQTVRELSSLSESIQEMIQQYKV